MRLLRWRTQTLIREARGQSLVPLLLFSWELVWCLNRLRLPPVAALRMRRWCQSTLAPLNRTLLQLWMSQNWDGVVLWKNHKMVRVLALASVFGMLWQSPGKSVMKTMLWIFLCFLMAMFTMKYQKSISRSPAWALIFVFLLIFPEISA